MGKEIIEAVKKKYGFIPEMHPLVFCEQCWYAGDWPYSFYEEQAEKTLKLLSNAPTPKT